MKAMMTGTVVGTGAAITVPLGFTPDYVKVFNITDADQYDEWMAGMAEGTSIQTNTAVATRATNGISLFAGSTSVAKGFVIGSGISESGKTLGYVAMRNIN
jgi:glucose/arabinose dehydrogenase